MFETKDKLVTAAAENHGLQPVPVMPFVWSVYDPQRDGQVRGYIEYDPTRPRGRYMVQRLDDEMHHDTTYHDHAVKAVECLA